MTALSNDTEVMSCVNVAWPINDKKMQGAYKSINVFLFLMFILPTMTVFAQTLSLYHILHQR